MPEGYEPDYWKKLVGGSRQNIHHNKENDQEADKEWCIPVQWNP